MNYRRYTVRASQRGPLLEWMLDALRHCGCVIIKHSPADEAPFRITFETPDGDPAGVVAYAFLANEKVVKNRPPDEHRFQVKYGSDFENLHAVWQDPYGLYTTLFLGINVERDFFVAADPLVHNPTRFSKSIEFKEEHAEAILDSGWHVWERRSTSRGLDEPVEVMLGGTKASFLRYVRFEHLAVGLDCGHRELLAENPSALSPLPESIAVLPGPEATHALSTEFALDTREILDLITAAPRLKMAVRGWVAERHLGDLLVALPGVSECYQLEADGEPDFSLRFEGAAPVRVECKNVLRRPLSDGTPLVDFQRTRASKADPCSRFYSASEFQILAACTHALTEAWDFRFVRIDTLSPHQKCPGRLANRVRVEPHWPSDPTELLRSLRRRGAGP